MVTGQFEKLMKQLLPTFYDLSSNISVGKGCICISWAIPDTDHTAKLVPELPTDLIQIIGVISLHIGDKPIYIGTGGGCKTIEAAMLQAIELKNIRAIELLIAVGCNPDVATYNEDNAVVNIVNIRERSTGKSGSRMDHTCFKKGNFVL